MLLQPATSALVGDSLVLRVVAVGSGNEGVRSSGSGWSSVAGSLRLCLILPLGDRLQDRFLEPQSDALAGDTEPFTETARYLRASRLRP